MLSKSFFLFLYSFLKRNDMNEKTRIKAKQKNIQLVIDYCIQQKTEFTVIPRIGKSEEWEVELTIKSIPKALEWGIFINTNKLEILNNQFLNTPENAVSQIKSKPKRKIKNIIAPIATSEISDIENEIHELKNKKEKNSGSTLLSFE